MASVQIKNASVEYPIFNPSTRSLKNNVMRMATGGVISKDEGGVVVVKSLNNISLTLEDGDRVGLIGHNGAGKTTLLRMLSGIYQPTKGEITVDGKCTSLINISLGICLLYTSPSPRDA